MRKEGLGCIPRYKTKGAVNKDGGKSNLGTTGSSKTAEGARDDFEIRPVLTKGSRCCHESAVESLPETDILYRIGLHIQVW